jgi:hypothetical protein
VFAVAGAQRLAAAGTTRENDFWMQGMKEIFRNPTTAWSGCSALVWIKKKDCSFQMF